MAKSDQRYNRLFTLPSGRDWPAAKSQLEDRYANSGPQRRLQTIAEFKLAYDLADNQGPVDNREIEQHIRDTIMRQRSQEPKAPWSNMKLLYDVLEDLPGIEVN